MAKRYRFASTTRVFPTAIRHATPPKPSCALAPKTYRKAVQLLADPNWSVLQISKTLRLSEHTVRAIRHREAQEIAERKKSLSAIVANVAELRSRADSRASVFDSGSIRLVLLV